jgi:acetyl-CoA C-acetyltransferase
MNKDQATIVIAGAARTPVGSFNGALASLPAHELGKVVIKAALERARVEAGDVSEVIMGQILAAGAGPEPGAAGLHQAPAFPVDAPAWGMNQLCGSGLRAVALGAQQIQARLLQDRGRRRPGEHEPGARTARICATAPRWAT